MVGERLSELRLDTPPRSTGCDIVLVSPSVAIMFFAGATSIVVRLLAYIFRSLTFRVDQRFTLRSPAAIRRRGLGRGRAP